MLATAPPINCPARQSTTRDQEAATYTGGLRGSRVLAVRFPDVYVVAMANPVGHAFCKSSRIHPTSAPATKAKKGWFAVGNKLLSPAPDTNFPVERVSDDSNEGQSYIPGTSLRGIIE